MAIKSDSTAQFRELKDIIEATNSNIKLLENRISSNQKELMARMYC